MKNNIVLMLIGIIILILPLILSYIKKDASTEKIIKTKKTKHNYSETKSPFNIENQIVIDRIKRLEKEVFYLTLKNENFENKLKNTPYINTNTQESINLIQDNNFKPILNYSVFKEKNVSIIELYEKGNSKEEIARMLNKSIREVEMVINLVN